VKLSGIGKFPFIELSEEKLNFEQMTVGKELTKKIILRNYSLVEAVFAVEKVNDDEKDKAFSLNIYEGKIRPGGSLTVTVKYSPSMVGAITCTQFSVSVLGGNTLKFSCTGTALGNDVCLSTKSIQFGEV